MVAAQASSLSGNLTVRGTADLTGLNRDRISRASVVLEFAPDQVDAVIAGAVGLDAAYATARERKTAAL